MKVQRAMRMEQPANRSHTTWVLLCASAFSLFGCSGGGGGGGGQSPDPATIDFPIFYVKRTAPDPMDMQGDDLRQMRDAVGDADLYKRDRASPSSAETNITERVTGTDLYDIKDVSTSADGTKVLFAMRGPLTENMEEEDPPTWNVWEYDIPTDTLRRVIATLNTAERGHDVAPAYLPDGRIVFSSTRQQRSKAILLNEGKPQFEAQNEDRNEPAFVLHVMDSLGNNIEQISFNQSNDLYPTVLQSGRVMWTRWDHAPGKNGMHLYAANPDGTDLQLLYGANSHETGTNNETIQFVRPREMQDGRILTLVRPFTDADYGGDLIMIDTNTYVENYQPTLNNAGMQGPAQSRATGNDVRTIEGPSPGGRFNSADPLWDGTNRILVGWSQCRLLDTTVTPSQVVACTDERLADPDAQPAPPLYSVWMFDPREDTLLPIVTPVEGVIITDIVAAQPRPLPTVILDQPQPDDDENVGVLNIRSVYDFDGVDVAPNIPAMADPMQTTAEQRPARFIRLEKPVSIPDDDVLDLDNAAFGVTNYMREILAYAPVEPDGSVRIKVPANVPFQISILDRDGRRISPVHANWLQVRAGEELRCNGCHTPATAQNPRSHGRANLFASVHAGAASTGTPFPNTVASLSPISGETMAETRTRNSCAADTTCPALRPSVDVTYSDVWTDPARRAPDAGFEYRYANLTTDMPTSAACAGTWTSRCRIVINYAQHIHPLWSVSRVTLAADGVTVLADNTCARAGCHNRVDAAGQPQVPAGQLELTDGESDEEPLHLRSYRELLFTDNEQEVNMGALQDRLVPGPIGPDGQPTLVPVSVAPSMLAGNARNSTRFFHRFAAGGTHAGWLTGAELRLISEWLDIGAQYFNNPFDPDAPVN
jgi:hypothetical protein